MPRYWYVIDTKEYWLEPDYIVGPAGRIRLKGAEIYSRDNRRLGYWYAGTMPIQVRKDIVEMVRNHEKRLREIAKRSERYLKRR